jgi:dipeptidyl-peptidase-4
MRNQTALLIAPLLCACASSQAAKGPSMTNAQDGSASAPATARLSEADEKFLRDLAETRSFALGKPNHFAVAPDGSRVLFLRAESRKAKNRLYSMEVASGQVRELITPDQVTGGAAEKLSDEEKARRERMRISGAGFTGFQLSRDGQRVLVSLSGRVFLVEIATAKSVEVAGTDEKGAAPFDAHLSPDGRQVAFVRGGELWVAPAGGAAAGAAKQLTSGATELITHAQAEFVAQEEMGRFTGHFWSADSQRLLYEEADATGVEQLHFSDPANLFGHSSSQPYPRPGKANVKVRLGMLPAAGGDTQWIKWDAERYPYLARVHWAQGAPPTIQVQTRDQRDLLLLEVDPASGATKELVHEHDDAWVNLHDDYAWLRDGSGFLWASERGGAWQLELRARDGRAVRTLTPLELGFEGLYWLDPQGRTAIVGAGKEPVEQQLYEIPLDGSPVRELTRGPGTHHASFARESRTYVHLLSKADAPSIAEVIRADGSVAGQIPAVNEEAPFLARVELAKVGAAPGYWTALIRPRDFDPKRRYPVWLSVYGGPGHNVVVAAADHYLFDQWIADHGFIVARVDNRGTKGRGRNWERAILHKFAEVTIEDQVAGLKALAAGEPAMDLSRVGVTGASFGGYLSALAVLRRPDAFKAAVATSSVTDWLDYDTHYTERYLGVPGKGDEIYARNGLLDYAANLSRPLLLIHGSADDNVLFSHTLKLADALFRAGRAFEMLPLAGQTHQVGADPVVRLQYWRRVFDFFRTHL